MGKQVEEKGLQLEDLKVSNLPELKGWKEKQEQLVKDNPYVEIVDNKTYTAACQNRTALLKGRTELEKQDKLIASKVASFRKEVKTETDILIAITLPSEEKQQAEVKRYETIKAEAKAEEERIEAERIEKIKTKIDDFETKSYALIATITFLNVEKVGNQINLIANEDFDYEEYDILFENAKARIQIQYDAKFLDVKEKEEQRLENERLEKENAEAKRLSDLQASRLNEILPYVAFGEEEVDLTKLSVLEESDYTIILSNKIKLFQADLKEKLYAEEQAKIKLEEEKEAIYIIRKKMLMEFGMNYSTEHDTFWLDENADYILLKDDIFDYTALEFEETFAEVKSIIESAKEKVEKEKVFEIRKNRLAEIGFTEGDDVFNSEFENIKIIKVYVLDFDTIDFERIFTNAKEAIEKAKVEAKKKVFENRKQTLLNLGFSYEENREYNFSLEGIWSCFHEQIDNCTDEWFEEYLLDIKNAINEKQVEQKAIDDKLAKEDAERLKKENKARIKTFAADKKLLIELVESLDFHNALPEMQNDLSEEMLNKLIIDLDELKKGWLNNVNNL